jgi:hypothetical protein
LYSVCVKAANNGPRKDRLQVMTRLIRISPDIDEFSLSRGARLLFMKGEHYSYRPKWISATLHVVYVDGAWYSIIYALYGSDQLQTCAAPDRVELDYLRIDIFESDLCW